MCVGCTSLTHPTFPDFDRLSSMERSKTTPAVLDRSLWDYCACAWTEACSFLLFSQPNNNKKNECQFRCRQGLHDGGHNHQDSKSRVQQRQACGVIKDHLWMGFLPSNSTTLASTWVLRLAMRLGTPIFNGLLASLVMAATDPPLQSNQPF